MRGLGGPRSGGVVVAAAVPPAPSTTEGALGLLHARAAGGPKSLRLRGWVQTRPTLHQQVPAPAGLAGKAWRVDRRAAPSREKAAPRREASGERYPRECPEWGRGLLEDAAARWNPLEVPQRPQHYGRPATLGARAGGEARRRPKVLPPLWTAGRVAPWVFGGVIRLSARGGKTGLREGEQPQIRRFRARLNLDEPEGSTNEGSLHVPTRSSAASAALHRVQELRVLPPPVSATVCTGDGKTWWKTRKAAAVRRVCISLKSVHGHA